MKVLFVCKSNVLRSQMAAALYGQGADSAGFSVSKLGECIAGKSDAADAMIRYMQDIAGKDVSAHVRTQVTPELAQQYEKVIVLEKENIPDFLANDSRVTVWDIENPNGKDETFYRHIIAMLEAKIQDLKKELNNEFTSEQKMR